MLLLLVLEGNTRHFATCICCFAFGVSAQYRTASTYDMVAHDDMAFALRCIDFPMESNIRMKEFSTPVVL